MDLEENKTCAICLRPIVTGQGQAIFTAECSHSFHFGCISNNVTHGNQLCPLCRAPWNDLPFVNPRSNPNINNPLWPYTTSNNSPRTPPVHSPTSGQDLIEYDDEPLLVASSASLQNVTIRAIPESPAVVASASVPCFSVLVGLKAPSLTEDALHAQRAPIDLVMILDVSGSMHGSKLALLKRAANFVIDNLGPSDRLSVISFSTSARKIFPLCRMVEHGRDNAKRAVNGLVATGLTNIVDGLVKGVEVLEQRRYQNSVASIVFLSDGQDTCNRVMLDQTLPSLRQGPPYLHLLPPSVCPSNGGLESRGDRRIIPVHTFGFGLDHDPIAMHAIADSSGGTFSFIETYEMVQDAFASCIGGLLSVVTQELSITVRSASHGVEIVSIPSGRYATEVTTSEGTINIGDLYADEEKEFLINLSVPAVTNATEQKTSLLDITCFYKDAVSQQTVHIQGDLVEIGRPEAMALTSPDNGVSIEVDRQRNRVTTADTITEATRLAEAGDLLGAQRLLSNTRSNVLASTAGQAQDELCISLEAEMRELQERMSSLRVYQSTGRAFAMSNMSAHAFQRATTRGYRRAGSDVSAGRSPAPNFVVYGTPQMAKMVKKSQQGSEGSIR